MHRIRFDIDSRMERTYIYTNLCIALVMSTSNIGITESTTTIEYPRSKRKIVKDSKGNIISDSAATIKDS
jgi:hypothetical protein